MRRPLLWPLMLIFLLPISAAFAGDFRIVPGQRIGTVTLGMSRPSVHALLHTPSTTHITPHGLILDTWFSHGPASNPGGSDSLKHDYLTVFFKRGHAVQIEASAAKFRTATGLSTHSSAHDFAKQYPHFQDPYTDRNSNPYVTGNSDPSASSPAAKHVLAYGDAVGQGIAWKYGAWGDLAPEPDPSEQEAVIVHVPGQTVLLNPNDGLPYSGTGPARK